MTLLYDLSYRAKKLEKDAKDWIFGNSAYFQEICFKAKMEPSFVIKLAKEAIALNSSKIKSGFKNSGNTKILLENNENHLDFDLIA